MNMPMEMSESSARSEKLPSEAATKSWTTSVAVSEKRIVPGCELGLFIRIWMPKKTARIITTEVIITALISGRCGAGLGAFVLDDVDGACGSDFTSVIYYYCNTKLLLLIYDKLC